ncbi:meiotic recombination protein DMC1/LIM15 [Sphaeroforma arctica JP610]|uniref:Meiotic recombination protein DMC1/LIM15 n=1 Tax=Sphaeroforma arctica JP610 TaxID=667725 RepID=A0A0L0FXF0_9EUKA|nr:meiotic recombination protein DMC1/LIM15 [Sphaeroforma arctica JP610]KNC81520.1 meiotic recombination protein DMC1/LIM15 [Sphaeroforma arctica JP610]|eukprot:XP_014155422.1 meiotic recombination protein DMC1/LIM15 [Sphaeroforma arctica JP610]
MTAADLRIKRESVVRCSTGSSDVDALLGGGIPSQQITEVFGEFRTGKSQLCHTMCVTAQLPTSLGGMEGKVAYIDTEGTFRPERLMPIADRFGVDRDAVLDNIMYARAYTSEHQMELLTICAAKFAEERGTFKLLIVDSIIALFRVDFSGRGELADRQQKLAHMLSCLVKLAEEFNVAVFITNQMTADPGANVTFVADPKKPKVLRHSFALISGRGDQRICKIYDSPDMPESEAVYQITNGGIDNPTS